MINFQYAAGAMGLRMLAVASMLVAAGCATTGTAPDSQRAQLADEQNFRTERVLFTTFPQIQQALFKHELACGVTYRFALEPRETSYASITYQPSDADIKQRGEAPLLATLVWYQPSFRQEERVKLAVYSQYANSAVDQRIQYLLAALERPTQCPGQQAEATEQNSTSVSR
ncbi:MAG: hypothetical protein GX049_04935 [Alcaligenaceae bacterium]|nr:hypothetical protein [Alcaligenaceae bacterium]